MSFPDLTAVLLDMDGVLYHGARPLPGAASLLGRIADLPHAFITNNPIRTPGEVADRLAAMGLARPDEARILTSAAATAHWLAREHPGCRWYAVGAEGLRISLREIGRESATDADFVVVGEGPGLDFDSLTRGINLILKRGARLVVTNPDHSVDATRDGEHLILPGGGALVAPFVAATGVEPVVIGKPEPLLYEMAMARLGVEAEHCLMIGDRPDTDIVGAVRLGLRTALVRTGRFAPEEAWPEGLPRPDWDFRDLDELLIRLNDLFPDRRSG